jgi:mono/diheme cytochrome c family protein
MAAFAAAAIATFLLIIGGATAFADGEASFLAQCAACHQPGGIGTPGLAPPIASDEIVRIIGDPDGRAYVPLVVLNGLSGPIAVAGQRYVSSMPAQPDLTDEEIADIAGYVLVALNGARTDGAGPYTPAEVAALRATPVSHQDLQALRRRLVP